MTKDRSQWEPVAIRGERHFSDKCVENLRGHLNLEAPNLHENLEEAASLYFILVANRGAPPPSKIEERLLRAKKAADELVMILEGIDTHSVRLFIDGQREKAWEIKNSIDDACSSVETKITKGGRTPDKALYALLNGLAKIYDRHVPFGAKGRVSFVHEALSVLNVKKTKSAVREQLNRAINEN